MKIYCIQDDGGAFGRLQSASRIGRSWERSQLGMIINEAYRPTRTGVCGPDGWTSTNDEMCHVSQDMNQPKVTRHVLLIGHSQHGLRQSVTQWDPANKSTP